MKPEKTKQVKAVRGWADVGSNGGIFEFQLGPVAQRYPYLMHIYSKQITSDLVEVLITPITPTKKKK